MRDLAIVRAFLGGPGMPASIGWARVLGKVFDIDLGNCPGCGSDLEIITPVLEWPMIKRLRTHLGGCRPGRPAAGPGAPRFSAAARQQPGVPGCKDCLRLARVEPCDG